MKWLDSSNIQSFALSHSPKVDYDTLLNSCLVCKDHENIDHVYFTVKGQPVGSSQQAQHVVPAKVADINRFEPARTKKEQKARESNIPAKAANVDRFQSAGTEEEQKARGLSREVLMKRRKKVVKKRQAPYRIVCEHETFSDRRDLILGRLGTTIYTLLL